MAALSAGLGPSELTEGRQRVDHGNPDRLGSAGSLPRFELPGPVSFSHSTSHASSSTIANCSSHAITRFMCRILCGDDRLKLKCTKYVPPSFRLKDAVGLLVHTVDDVSSIYLPTYRPETDP
jgi:hypothetical protein